jgi:antirestriction protein ArdC
MSSSHAPAVYQRITNQIIAALDRGVTPWVRPWRAGMPFNAVSSREYQGVNILTTWLHQLERGLTSNAFVTFRQARALGGSVRQGERGCPVDFFKPVPRSSSPGQDGEEQDWYFLARGYTVFGIEQCTGLDELTARVATPQWSGAPIEHCEAVLARSGVPITFAGDRAFYSPISDNITLPPREQFLSAEGFYSTAFHKLVHATGAPHRLNRDLTGRFGSTTYAVEEMVAELGAAFVAARSGIELVSQAASYLESWLGVLRADSRALFAAARHASQAADFLTGATNPSSGDQSGAGADDQVAAPEAA